MTLWEFAACLEGYRRANSPPDKPETMSPEEFRAGIERHVRMTTTH